ncbi:hypothetical protein [Paraclostridium dentum]|uniref:hypothetical protein n=1 Tax=Paraclostridium dentum TaxID=2662455 RepID=UPI003464A2BD
MKTEKKQTRIITNEKAEKRRGYKGLNESADFNYSPRCNRLKPNMPENEDVKKLKDKK